MNDIDLELATELLLSEAPVEDVGNFLVENYFKEERHETQMEYLYLVEQFFDECSVYAFGGWEEGIVLAPPTISKFWVECVMSFPISVDLSGATRLLGKNKENKLKIDKKENRVKIKFSILRSTLDALEQENRVAAKKEAELEGYKEEAPEEQNQDAGMGGIGNNMGGGF